MVLSSFFDWMMVPFDSIVAIQGTAKQPCRSLTSKEVSYIRSLESLHALAAEFAFEFPGGAVGVERFADPVERVRRDLGEAPARRRAVHACADLHDVVVLAGADAAADLLFVMIRYRIDPADTPGLDRRVPDAESGAVHIVCFGEIGVALRG